MSVPTHGPYCQTLVYGTSCWDCQEGIWILTCTCGSAVLLDECGPPWPKHDCSNRYGAGGVGGSGLSGWVAFNKLLELGVPISADVRQKIFPRSQNSARNAERGAEIKRIKPRDGKRQSLLAVVRELHSSTRRITNVDALPALGRQLLGLHPAARYRQITLVTNLDRPNKSFTALVPDHLVQGLKRGVMVTADMFGSVIGDFASWVITDIDPF